MSPLLFLRIRNPNNSFVIEKSPVHPMDAIVLDGDQRSALAVTRSLGRKGVKVIVGADTYKSLSSCSRYCSRSFVYSSPYLDPGGFLRDLEHFLEKSRNSILLPMTDVTLTEILRNRQEIPGHIVIPFVDYEKYAQVTDKTSLFRFARDLNVPIPTTFFSTDYGNRDHLVEAVMESGFPVVVKPSVSKIRTETGWMNAKVHYAKDEQELREILSIELFLHFPFLVQERIEGAGVGIFLLMKDGEVISKFAHRRIREKPPSGGVSVLCESIEPPADAAQAAIRILGELQWTGVAMVEFKIDREENAAKLLEVNARFWGSLQLAISSGVDFPHLLFRMARGEEIRKSDTYRIGLKSRWELGDLDHLIIRFSRNSASLNLSSGHSARMVLLKDFLLDFIRPSVKNEIMQPSDSRPFLHELNEYVKHLFQRTTHH